MVSGSVDATVITSPAEYAAKKQGLRVIMSAQELGQLVRIPITGIGATQKKMEKDPDQIVRLLRALRLSTLYLVQNSEYSRALFQRIMHVDAPTADKLFKLYRDQYNPELTLPDSIVDDLLAVGTFRLKEKPKALSQQAVRDWSLWGEGEAVKRRFVSLLRSRVRIGGIEHKRLGSTAPLKSLPAQQLLAAGS